MNSKVMLIIRDGWGYDKPSDHNAISLANTPFHDMITKEYPTTLLGASEKYVGLPQGQFGNSEVGHTTIGLGKVIKHPVVKINEMIEDGIFYDSEVLGDTIDYTLEHNSRLNIIGIIQDKNVHGSTEHYLATIRACLKKGQHNINLHIITDGRDEEQGKGLIHLKKINELIKDYPEIQISTISGRFYAMDRDNRMERTEQAFDTIFKGESLFKYTSAEEFIETMYDDEVGEEFIEPTINIEYKGIGEYDSVIFTNFRTDRPRQLSKMLLEDENFKNNRLLTFTQYSQELKELGAESLIEPEMYEGGIGQTISQKGLSQLRISETEKYAHVTFFFNGQKEEPYSGEDRVLVPSPKEVRTYDEKPEMSASKIADELIKAVKDKQYNFVVCNLVNADMVGHTGNIEATATGCEAVDQALARIYEETKELGYSYIVTADHGNCDDMSGVHNTTHTLSPVELTLITDKEFKLKGAKEYKEGNSEISLTLADIAKIVEELI